MQPPLPPLSRLAIAALRVPLRDTGAGGLALDGPASVPTQAKRDADGLAVDVRSFLADARGILASIEREVVFEHELVEEARALIERGAQLATNAIVVEAEDKKPGGEIAERVPRPGAQAPQRVTCTRPPHVDCHVRCPCSRPTPVPEGQRAGATAQLPERFGDATSGQVRLGPSAPVVLVASA